MKRVIILLSVLIFALSSNAQVKCFQGFQDKKISLLDDVKKIADAIVIGHYSVDPNELVGPEGYDSLRWVSADAVLNYTIYFENDPEFATAAAQKVDVRFDFRDKGLMKNFGIGDYSFANMSFSVPRKSNAYQERIDFKDSLGYYVDLIAGLDVARKQGFWTFTTIDPETGYAPWQADMGMLPVNDSTHIGEGFVTFSMTPARGMKTGDVIELSAGIVFDENDTIVTNSWRNTVDAGLPVSRLSAKKSETGDDCYVLTFEAVDDDNGSGVSHVLLYSANSNGVYEEIARCSPDSILDFVITPGRMYQLYSLAVDNVGNVEESKTTPDVVLNFNMSPTDILLSDTVFRDDLEVGGYVGRLSTVDSDDEVIYKYELVEGEGALHNDMFMIDNDVLRIRETFKCAEDTLFKVRISTTDSGNASFAKSFSLLLENVLEKPEPDTLAVEICEGDAFEFYGSYYEESGVYRYTTDNEYMCDSVHILMLTVLPQPEVPVITVRGTHTLVSSAAKGNQWYRADGSVVEGANGQEFTPNESGIYYVEVSNGVCSAVSSKMYEVNLTDYAEFEVILPEGWSWVSSNVKGESEGSVEDYLKPFKDVVIEMNDGEKLIYPYDGDVVMLYPEKSYRLQVSESVINTVRGVAYAPEKYPVLLKKGWNRIGYLPVDEMRLNLALANLKPSENDVVKSLTEFAIYANGKWNGTLEKMRPGEGYMYYSSFDNEFCYPVSRVSEVSDEAKGSNSTDVSWNYDRHRFADNMTMVASLYLDYEPVLDGVYTVAAFVNNECRGVGRYSDGLLYLTIHGSLNSNEIVTFKAVNNIKGDVADIDEKIEFNAMHYGNFSEPFRLNLLNKESVESTSLTSFCIYPNPVKDVMYITGNITLIDEISILTTNGKVILVSNNYTSDGINVTCLPAGTYIVAISTLEGTFYRKIIKK